MSRMAERWIRWMLVDSSGSTKPLARPTATQLRSQTLSRWPGVKRMTRGVVERAGLDVMELAARLVGTRSAFDGQRIDKITRDLSLYLRQAGPDHARDQAAIAWLDHDVWGGEDALW